MRKRGKAWSFQMRITLFLLIMMLMESLLFVGFLVWGNVLTQFDQNASDVFVEEISNRAAYLKTDMIQRWGQLDWTQSTVEETVSAYLEERGISAEELVPGSEDTTALLGRLAPDLVSTLRRNTINGVFVVFHGNGGDPSQPQENAVKGGIYIRDTDPSANSDSNADLSLRYGPHDLVNQLGIAMDINWNPAVTVQQDSEWYYSALQAVARYPYATRSQLGHWAPMHTLVGDQDPKVITYTQPLVDEAGVPYGVLGMELTETYLRRSLPYSELPGERNSSSYVLAYSAGGDGYQIMSAAGPLSTWLFGEEKTFRLAEAPEREPLYRALPAEGGPEEKVYSYVQELQLYDANSPFEEEHWYLVGMSRGEDLFAYTAQVRQRSIALLLVAMVSGVALSLLVGVYFSRPINKISAAIRDLDPNRPVELEPTNIREIDELARTITTVSQEITESLSRTNRIIDTVSAPIAVFQFNQEVGRLSCSSRFYSILGLPEPDEPLTGKEFEALLADLGKHVDQDMGDGETLILRLPDHYKPGETRWVRFQRLRNGNYVLGILIDVTDSREKLARIEFERDHDTLTGLSNRLAFRKHMAELSRQEDPGVCAVLMMDLDNLKSVNDTYGHEYGDEYIRGAANVLRRFAGERCFPARISGDEFYIAFSGYSSREEIEECIARFRAELIATDVRLPQGQLRRLRASAGVAWYPDDTQRLEDLVHYADFAMYQAKHSSKGSLCYFDIKSYNRDSVMVYDNAELDRIIETASVRFVFQPIVSCRDGSTLGYECLMRPCSPVFTSPEDLLQIARIQSKLHHIEVLTWLEGTAAFLALPWRDEGARLFLNSIPSQSLSPEEVEEYERRFPGMFSQTVLELIESDEGNTEYTEAKIRRGKKTGMMIALDDFGSGYSNESLLLELHPHFVKIDMDVIRGIDLDFDRQTVFRGIAESCHSMGSKVIAEGVETLDQLRTVISLGADYIQGFYIGRPAEAPEPVPHEICNQLRAAWKDLRAEEPQGSR